jgi:hypothetical protein
VHLDRGFPQKKGFSPYKIIETPRRKMFPWRHYLRHRDGFKIRIIIIIFFALVKNLLIKLDKPLDKQNGSYPIYSGMVKNKNQIYPLRLPD